jgi:hypothetical protein
MGFMELRVRFDNDNWSELNYDKSSDSFCSFVSVLVSELYLW